MKQDTLQSLAAARRAGRIDSLREKGHLDWRPTRALHVPTVTDGALLWRTHELRVRKEQRREDVLKSLGVPRLRRALHALLRAITG